MKPISYPKHILRSVGLFALLLSLWVGGAVMTPTTLYAQSGPSLTIPNATVDGTSGTATVHVEFAASANAIAALGFSIDYDATCLSIDVTDADNNGIPDAVYGLPSSNYIPSISHDAGDADGELDISFTDQSQPLTGLENGPIVSIDFTVAPSCDPGDGSSVTASVNFSEQPTASFGDTSGASVGGSTTNGTITINYAAPNSAPTGVILSGTSVDENADAGTLVATLGTTDPDDLDGNDTYNYSIVEDPDNAFEIVNGNELVTAEVFNFEETPIFLLSIETTDGAGESFTEELIEIQVNNVNEEPILTVGAAFPINENVAPGAVVAAPSAEDPDDGNPFGTLSFSLHGDDASSFTFNEVDGSIESAVSFDYEVKSSYVITVRVTDGGGLFDEESLTVNIEDLAEFADPAAVDDLYLPGDLNIGGSTELLVLSNDNFGGYNSATALMDGVGDSDYISLNSNSIQYTPPADQNGSEVFTYTFSVFDYDSGNGASSNEATVTVHHVANDPRGDCNSDGNVNAGDFSAVALEYFDTDNSSNWYEIYQAGYSGSPLGCDANADQNVGVADIIRTVCIFFADEASCSGGGMVSAASVAPSASLSVDSVSASTGETVNVPVSLSTRGNAIAAAGFTIEYDAATLAFDATDANGDGLPDALEMNVPAGTNAWAQVSDGSIQIALAGLTLPLPSLNDGTLATATFTAVSNGGSVRLSNASLGNTQGQAVNVTVPSNSDFSLFVPLLVR